VKYAAIADWAPDKQYSIAFMCDQLGVVRQGYYRWRSTGACARERTDTELTETIREIHRELHGHPRCAPGLRRARRARGAGRRQTGLAIDAGRWPARRHPRAWRKTTIVGPRPVDAPDLIGQDFTAAAPDTRWCGDITYVRTVDGWVYTATVIDLKFPQSGRLRRRRPPAYQPDHRGSCRGAAHPQTPGRGHLP